MCVGDRVVIIEKFNYFEFVNSSLIITFININGEDCDLITDDGKVYVNMPIYIFKSVIDNRNEIINTILE